MPKLVIKKVPLREGQTGEYVFSLYPVEGDGIAILEGEDFTDVRTILEYLGRIGMVLTGGTAEDVVVHLSKIVEVTE